MLRRTLLALCLVVGLFIGGRAQAQDEHSFDLLFGRSGTQATCRLESGAEIDIQTYLSAPKTFDPNFSTLTLPAYGLEGYKGLYFDWGTNAAFSGNPVRRELLSCTLQGVTLSPGLIVEYAGQVRMAGAALDGGAGIPTAANNALNYAGNFHRHLNVYAFRPGTYTLTFRLTNAKQNDAAQTPLTDSPEYAYTLRSRPVLSGRLTLTGWVRADTSPYRTGNVVRVFIFPANANPSSESEAIATTEVYPLPDGSFALPEGLQDKSFNLLPSGSYRVGFKPLTAAGLARLIPGNVTLSPTAPTTLTNPVVLPLGDVNRDGFIDELDYNEVIQRFYADRGASGLAADSDVNGDDFIDEFDYNEVIQNFYLASDFNP